jgi:hypothetical protein
MRLSFLLRSQNSVQVLNVMLRNLDCGATKLPYVRSKPEDSRAKCKVALAGQTLPFDT